MNVFVIRGSYYDGEDFLLGVCKTLEKATAKVYEDFNEYITEFAKTELEWDVAEEQRTNCKKWIEDIKSTNEPEYRFLWDNNDDFNHACYYITRMKIE